MYRNNYISRKIIRLQKQYKSRSVTCNDITEKKKCVLINIVLLTCIKCSRCLHTNEF